MLLSISGAILIVIKDVIRYRKGIYNPYYFRVDKEYHWLYKALVLLLIIAPTIWIENPDSKRVLYMLILILLLCNLNVLNWLSISKLSVRGKQATVVALQTIMASFLLAGIFIFLMMNKEAFS